MREAREIPRAGVVAGRVESARVREMRVGECPRRCARVHPRDEARLAAGDVLGEREAGVVGGPDEKPGEKLGHDDLRADRESHAGRRRRAPRAR